MFNQSGITKKELVNVRQILANEHFIAISAVLDNSAKDSDNMCYAGTPLYGDFLQRDGGSNAFVKETTTSNTSNANCVLLHDVEFSGTADANATVLIHGAIQKGKCESSVQTLLTADVIEALKLAGIYCI